jgi:chromate transporter
MWSIFTAFLKLGLTSFGGPIAHIGYFHREFVERRRWLDATQYAHLLAVSQFLPGPASSQVGFSIGLIRAGWLGGLAAFCAFTLPSAILMVAFAHALPHLDAPLGQALLHGFKLVAVAVVAHGLVTMAQRLTPDWQRGAIAVAAAAAIIASGSAAMQVAVVVAGGLLGLWLCRHVANVTDAGFELCYGVRAGIVLLGIFSVLLVVALAMPRSAPESLQAAAAFFRTGALVFGGAHVVLPLLEETVVGPGLVTHEEFLAGYGAAQTVPGPMFSVAAFLGARLDADASAVGATICLLAIFLPGLLMAAGVLPLWRWITSHKAAASALAGINAAVVGLLAAAFYDPVWTTAVTSVSDGITALVGFALLLFRRTSVLFVLLWCVAAALLQLIVES